MEMLPIVKRYAKGYAFYDVEERDRISPIMPLEELLLANYLGVKEDVLSAVPEDPYGIVDWKEARLAAKAAIAKGEIVDTNLFKYYSESIVEKANEGTFLIPTRELTERFLRLWCGFTVNQYKPRVKKRKADEINSQS